MISVIISTAGGDSLRHRNFLECIKSIEDNRYRDFEIVVVECSLDGKFYKQGLGDYRHIKISDPERRGFNLNWLRNVGARNSSGETLVLLDSDVVVRNDYLLKVAKQRFPFYIGYSSCSWCWAEEPVQEWIKRDRDLDYIKGQAVEPGKGSVAHINALSKEGGGTGLSWVFDRSWFWNRLGGLNESFFQYGWEDRADIERAFSLLKVSKADAPKMDSDIVHLYHNKRDVEYFNKNKELFEKLKTMDQIVLSNIIKSAQVGKRETPTPITLTT